MVCRLPGSIPKAAWAAAGRASAASSESRADRSLRASSVGPPVVVGSAVRRRLWWRLCFFLWCLATQRVLPLLLTLRLPFGQREALLPPSSRLPAPWKAAEAGVVSAGGLGEGWQASPWHSGRVVSVSERSRRRPSRRRGRSVRRCRAGTSSFAGGEEDVGAFVPPSPPIARKLESTSPRPGRDQGHAALCRWRRSRARLALTHRRLRPARWCRAPRGGRRCRRRGALVRQVAGLGQPGWSGSVDPPQGRVAERRFADRVAGGAGEPAGGRVVEEDLCAGGADADDSPFCVGTTCRARHCRSR